MMCERAPDALPLEAAAEFEVKVGFEAEEEKEEAAVGENENEDENEDEEDEGRDNDGAYFEPGSGDRDGNTREAMTGAMPLLGEIRNGYDECCERPLSSGKANEAVLEALMLEPRIEAEVMCELLDEDRFDARLC